MAERAKKKPAKKLLKKAKEYEAEEKMEKKLGVHKMLKKVRGGCRG